MSVKIIIERKFKEAPVPENFQTLDSFRVHAMQQKGYVSGETLVNAENNREVVVVSTWSDFDDFNTWTNSKERVKLENGLTPYLEGPAKITAFMLGADAIDEMFGKIIHDSEVES